MNKRDGNPPEHLCLVALENQRGRVVFNTVLGAGSACANRSDHVAYQLLHHINTPERIQELFGPGGMLTCRPTEPRDADDPDWAYGSAGPGRWRYDGVEFLRDRRPWSPIVRLVTPKRMRSLDTFARHLYRMGPLYGYVHTRGEWWCNTPMLDAEPSMDFIPLADCM